MLLQALMLLNQAVNIGVIAACGVVVAPFELIERISRNKEKSNLDKKLSADKDGFIYRTILNVETNFGIINCIVRGDEGTDRMYMKKAFIGSSWEIQDFEKNSIATVKKASKSGSSLLYIGDVRISWIFPKAENKYELCIGELKFEINRFPRNGTITVGANDDINMKITRAYGERNEYLIECKEETDKLLGLFIVVAIEKL